MTIRSVSIPVSRPFAITPWLPFRLDERERGGCRPSTGSSRRARAVAVVFSLDQHGPDDARGFGGERHHGDLVGSPREQIAQPWIGDAARLLLPQMSAGSADQQRPQHAISLFGDAPGTMLATGAMVFTSEPNPGREVATGAEHLRIGHFGQDRAGDDRADAWDFHQPPGVPVATGRLRDLSLQHPLVSIERLPVLSQQQQRAPHHLRNLLARLLELAPQFPQPLISLRRHDPKLAQCRPQRVRYHRSLPNQQGPRAVNSYRRLLLDALHRHEPHRWPAHRLADRLRVPAVVLVALHIGP